jgi:hypothetical protein
MTEALNSAGKTKTVAAPVLGQLFWRDSRSRGSMQTCARNPESAPQNLHAEQTASRCGRRACFCFLKSFHNRLFAFLPRRKGIELRTKLCFAYGKSRNVTPILCAGLDADAHLIKNGQNASILKRRGRSTLDIPVADHAVRSQAVC